MKKFRSLLSLLLILCLFTPAQAVTEAEVRELYPDAKILKVSPAQYSKYQKLYAQNSNEIVNKNIPTTKREDGFKQNKVIKKRPCWVNDEYEDNTKNSVKSDAVINPNFNVSGSSGGDGKEFLIIIAVIGVVVVAALAVYSVGYIYEMASQGFDCKAWNEFGLRASYVSDSNDAQLRDGHFTGAYFSWFYHIPLGLMGLTIEGGEHNLDLDINGISERRKFEGFYAMIGPSFSIPLGQKMGPAFQIELLAGTSEEDDIGLLSTLRLGFDFPITKGFNLGVNLGAALIDIHGYDNYLKDSDHLNYLVGFSTAYRF